MSTVACPQSRGPLPLGPASYVSFLLTPQFSLLLLRGVSLFGVLCFRRPQPLW